MGQVTLQGPEISTWNVSSIKGITGTGSWKLKLKSTGFES